MNGKKSTGLPEGVTQEMLDGWKARYGDNKIKLFTITTDEGNQEIIEAVGRVPDRVILSEFEKWMDKNPLKAKEIVVNNCMLTKLEEIKASDWMFGCAFSALAELIPVGKAEVKNL